VRRFLSRSLKLGAVIGAGYAVWRILESRKSDSHITPAAQPVPSPPGPRRADVHIPSQLRPPGGPETSDIAATWVEPVEDVCPTSHPVKAALSSGTFHVPGEPAYDSTRPDRCYLDTSAAEADGLHPGGH
jgi:hypothetical protein